MKMKAVIQITTDDNIEEQYILEKYPEAVWINLSGRTLFFLNDDEYNRTEILEVITQWEERNM